MVLGIDCKKQKTELTLVPDINVATLSHILTNSNAVGAVPSVLDVERWALKSNRRHG